MVSYEADVRQRKSKRNGVSKILSLAGDGLADKPAKLNSDCKGDVIGNDGQLGKAWPASQPQDSLKTTQSKTKLKNGSVANKDKNATLSNTHRDNQGMTASVKDEIPCVVSLQIDLLAIVLAILGLSTRLYSLSEPNSVVFDELHYGKYTGMYMRGTFFFDSHPPLGKQLIAGAAYLAGFDGGFRFDRIGGPYNASVPVSALRAVPAVSGGLIVPAVYYLLTEIGLGRTTGTLAAVLVLLDNALLTQSKFILMEPMLILFGLVGILSVVKLERLRNISFSPLWWFWLVTAGVSLSCALSVKYIGFFTCCLALFLSGRDLWIHQVGNKCLNDVKVLLHTVARIFGLVLIPMVIYFIVFYIHLSTLTKAGPHDALMTSNFQASLEGGLASIVRGQPLEVAHGSQVTLRHTHGRTCWLHSHSHVYPVRYTDKRGSSHQQQVTCYSFKDVNNWWIVKRPLRDDLAVGGPPLDVIKHGDIIQLVHGITGRALNSHDVAAPVSPQHQEVSCYIDYNISMPAQNLWKLEIINRDQVGEVWHSIESEVRLVHLNSTQALKFSGRQLPEWGFNQHEVVTDRSVNQPDTAWNVEEHRYTKNDDQKERERELVSAEMIPTRPTSLSFWDKMVELQYKMLFSGSGGGGSGGIHQQQHDAVQNHLYSSDPLEWPCLTRGIAYWVSPTSNAQIHLLGNIVIWYSGTAAVIIYCALLVLYLLRRRRHCYDLSDESYAKFVNSGRILLTGYLIHYIPFFFADRTLFLHHYLPAYVFKIMLLAAVVEHLYQVIREIIPWRFVMWTYKIVIGIWLLLALLTFSKFAVLSYGIWPLSSADVVSLAWKDGWDLIIHKN